MGGGVPTQSGRDYEQNPHARSRYEVGLEPGSTKMRGRGNKTLIRPSYYLAWWIFIAVRRLLFISDKNIAGYNKSSQAHSVKWNNSPYIALRLCSALMYSHIIIQSILWTFLITFNFLSLDSWWQQTYWFNLTLMLNGPLLKKGGTEKLISDTRRATTRALSSPRPSLNQMWLVNAPWLQTDRCEWLHVKWNMIGQCQTRDA